MTSEKKEIEVSQKLLLNIVYGVVIGYVLIVLIHIFQEKWNSYHPYETSQNYWFIKCPLNDDIKHKGSSELSGAFSSPFSHFILWLVIIAIITVAFRFFQTTKIKVK